MQGNILSRFVVSAVGVAFVLSLSACYSGPIPPATPTVVVEEKGSDNKAAKPTPPDEEDDDLPVLK